MIAAFGFVSSYTKHRSDPRLYENIAETLEMTRTAELKRLHSHDLIVAAQPQKPRC